MTRRQQPAIKRTRSEGRSGSREQGREILEQLFRRRYFAVVLIAAGALAIGLPIVAVILIVVAGAGATLVGQARMRRTGVLPPWVHGIDLAICITYIMVLPEAALPALAIMVAIVCLAATTSGVRTTVVLIALGSAGLAAAHLVTPMPRGWVAVLAFIVAGGIVATAIAPLVEAQDDLRARLDMTVNNLDAVLWIRDPTTGTVTFVNDRAPSVLGWGADTLMADGFWESRIHPDDIDAARTALSTASTLGVDHEVIYRFAASDDRWIHLHDHMTPLHDGTGRATALHTMSIDITEQVGIAQRVDQYAEIVDRIDLALVVARSDDETGSSLRLVAANAAADRLLDRDLSEAIGATVEEAFPGLTASGNVARIRQANQRNTSIQIDDLVITSPNRAPRVVTLRAFPLSGHAIAVSLQDVTEALEASEALRRQALFDGLTGLPNRHLLDDELHRAVRETPTTGEDIALLMMDLDQFKEVNDALGHQVGDRLLAEIGHRIAQTVPDALVARLGGDEFAVVLVGHLDTTVALDVARQVREALSEPVVVDDLRLQSNASIGICLFPTQARDVATLIQRADVAMYQAKRTGSGVAVYAPESDRSSVERLTLIAELPRAVADGELVLHYQPAIDLRSGVAVRAEALVRWEHPELGLLGPEHFIELAELSGAIGPLTRWVIAEGARAMQAWRAAGHHMGLAVNLSVRNLYDPDLVTYLAEQLWTAGIDPSQLALELTETELMDDPGLAREVFTAFGDLGVSTSIDDFGTGYSSLTYLLELPLQEIKIDKSFVSGLHAHSDEFTIVRSMIDLGHNLGLEVVAEGVETTEDLALLRRLGCDLAQGYHLSQPLPLQELIAWLDARPGG